MSPEIFYAFYLFMDNFYSRSFFIGLSIFFENSECASPEIKFWLQYWINLYNSIFLKQAYIYIYKYTHKFEAYSTG